MLKREWLLAGVIWMVVGLVQPSPAADEPIPFMVVKDGQATAVVVIPDKAPRTVTFAAEEFVAYVKKASGAEIKILPESKWQEKPGEPVVLIGPCAASEKMGITANRLAAGGLRIRREENKLFLLGRDDTVLVWRDKPYEMDPRDKLPAQWGTLWAVYEFLEQFVGVRWYWPGELGEIIPERKTIAVGEVDIIEAPDFEYRRPTGFSVGIAPEEMWLWWRRVRAGGAGNANANHGFAAYPERYGKTHPEYFALQKDGTRLTTDVKGGDPCFSNPDLKRIWTQDCIEYLKTHPDFFSATVMPGDSFGNYCCQCPECKAKYEPALGETGVHSRIIWTYVNDIAREVGKQVPGRYVGCCAYTSYHAYPKGLKLEPNVSVTVCREDLELYAWDEKDREKSHRDILDWTANATKVFTWEYPVLLTRQVPAIVYPHGINREYRWLKGKILGSYITFEATDALALDNYVLMKTMWKTDIDVDLIVHEYCRDLFGPAAAPMETFYRRMEEIWTKGDHGHKPYYENWDNIWGKLYNQKVLREVMGYLDQARKLCPAGSVYEKRMERVLKAFSGIREYASRYEKSLSFPNRALACVRTARPPVVDGVIRPEEWKGAALTESFVEYMAAAEPKVQNHAFTMYDARNLYVAVFAGLIPGQEIRLTRRGHDDSGICNNDSVEIFLTGKDERGALHKYQLIVDSLGELYDAHGIMIDLAQDFPNDPEWESGVSIAVKVGRDAWTMVAGIPLKNLEIAAGPGKLWKVNFNHNYFIKENGRWQRQFLAWNPTFGGFHNINRFGTLQFE